MESSQSRTTVAQSRSSKSGNPLNKKTLPRQSSFILQPKSAKEKPVKSAKLEGIKVTGSKSNEPSKPPTKTGKKTGGPNPPAASGANKKFEDMIKGDLTDLPPLPKSMVRIFLSSTFSDMRQERNILAREVYPKLRQYCAGLGLAFQVVDMRWGVTEDSQNDHSVEKICLLEVKNCQNVSKGPNFVVLSGDRYGFRPIPSEVDVEEFDKIVAMATQLNLPDRDLLTTWYKLDENSVPPIFILQPIRSKFTFFGDYSPGCDEPRKKDTADWWTTFGKLQEILRKCVTELHTQNKISSERKHSYFYSVTECEIEEGILKATDTNSHCLVYQRQFQNLDKQAASDTDAGRFKEFVTKNGETQVDKEAQEIKESLVNEKIKNKLSEENMRKYLVPWLPGGLDLSNEKHAKYLTNFCTLFIEDCMKLIEGTIKAEQTMFDQSNLFYHYEELLHHQSFCLTKCRTFCGQEKILKAAKSYILNEQDRSPLIIHAESGAGKTSIMAMIMKKIPDWFERKSHMRMIRFLGTTPRTNDIYDVLLNVVKQMGKNYNVIISPIHYKNMKALTDYIPRFLRQISLSAKEPVIVLLDSIDQLNSNNRAYSMEWLPTTLPQNVKFIISTLPVEHGILDNIKKVLPQEQCYINVPLLSSDDAQTIADHYLKISKRKLTEEQMKLLLSEFRGSPSPLFLKLLLDEAKKWPSYLNYATLEALPTTVLQAINKLFEILEKKFGNLLISHALGYITIGLGGLNDIEIEDVLSCDDAVLNDLYRYHDPPVPGHVRMPPLLWARIRFDLKEYLVEKLSHGKNTLCWYHRQFIQTARSRYCSEGKDKELHKNLTDVYLQDTGMKRTIVLKNRKGLEIPDADRQVTPQPFEAKNQRKLACLPYHAMQAYSVIGSDIAKSKIFLNFRFLCTKIAAFSLSEATADLSKFLDINEDEEVTMLRNYLSVAKDNLTQPVRLAVCLLAYIHPSENHRYLLDLQDQCLTFLKSQTTPVLVPEFPCLAPRQDASSALNTSLQGYTTILAQSETYLLLEPKMDKDSFEENALEYALFNTNTEDIDTFDLTGIFKSVIGQNYRLNGETLLYITKDSLLAYNMHRNETSTFVYSQSIPKWSPRSSVVSDLFVDVEGEIGILVMKSFLIHVNLSDMSFVQQFDSRRKYAEIQSCLVFKTVEGFKTVVMGIMASSSEDQPQGPENSSFIAAFESGKQTPLRFIQLDEDINSSSFVCAAKNEWVVGVMLNNRKPDEKEQDKKVTQSFSLLTFQTTSPYTHRDICMPGKVDKLIGNPLKPEVLTLLENGCAYLVQVESGKSQLEIKLNYPIKSLDVLWEDRMAFLCFNQGNIAMYDLEHDKNLGAFSAHSTLIKDIYIIEEQAITIAADGLKLWSVQQLADKAKTEEEDVDTTTIDLLTQMAVTSFIVIGTELITCSSDGFLRIWDSDGHTFLRQYHTDMVVSLILEMVNDALVLLDETAGNLLIFDIFSGQPVVKTSDFPHKVLAITENHARESLYVISELNNGQVQVDVYNIQMGKITKSFPIQKGFTYEQLSVMLTVSERFLVLMAKISDAEYNSIAEMSKKGHFEEQPHRYKFCAIDLSQCNGGLMPCYRRLTNIPVLGVKMSRYRANTVLISTRRFLLVWDIPTGGCDQKTVKNKTAKMFYRPSWMGPEHKGVNNALVISKRQEFVAVGSEDGYVMIYDAELGIPRDNVKPSKRHKADVHMLAISPDNKWVASSCRGSVLKLWDSTTGKEVFSIRLDAVAQQMSFTKNSKKLVLFTGSQTTRVIMLKVHEGEK